jgi:hypothetical protein
MAYDPNLYPSYSSFGAGYDSWSTYAMVHEDNAKLRRELAEVRDESDRYRRERNRAVDEIRELRNLCDRLRQRSVGDRHMRRRSRSPLPPQRGGGRSHPVCERCDELREQRNSANVEIDRLEAENNRLRQERNDLRAWIDNYLASSSSSSSCSGQGANDDEYDPENPSITSSPSSSRSSSPKQSEDDEEEESEDVDVFDDDEEEEEEQEEQEEQASKLSKLSKAKVEKNRK